MKNHKIDITNMSVDITNEIMYNNNMINTKVINEETSPKDFWDGSEGKTHYNGYNFIINKY